LIRLQQLQRGHDRADVWQQVSNNGMTTRMRRLKLARRSFAGLVMAPLMVLLSRGVVEGCKCPPEPAAAEALGIADVVFVGTIIDQRAYVSFDESCTGPAIEYDVIVERAWKGVFERRVSLQRSTMCSPALRVGQTALIYAGRHNDELFVRSCLPTKRVDEAVSDIAQLGAAIATFPGHAEPVATSLPISRWIRAHVIAGIGVYAAIYAEWPLASFRWDMLVLTAAAALQALAAMAFLMRKRWRVGTRFLAGGALTLGANICWTGHVFLRSDWSSAFLMW
jgi:hypothetical protein